MEIILLVVIAVVFLVGLVAFAMGRQGWNWGTITAGILVLLAALGFTFLAGMVGQQERAWREIIANYQKKIEKERDGLGAGNEGAGLAQKSIATLEQEKARWQRVWNRVDEWGGRSWPTASFTPPTDGRPGTITVEDVEKLTVVTGAEVYVFDQGDIADEGRFLGAFHVDAVNGNNVSISPAAPPTDDDRKLWAKPREAVSVYETLPNDTWLAFHTLSPKKDEETPGDEASVLPTPRITDPEDLLKHLEGRLEEVRQHAEVVPEEKLPEVFENLKQGNVTPGRYWAKVEFKEPHSFPITGREPAQFESGQTGEFDLETAQKLKEDGVVDIVAVESRRPLVDPLTAIRGGEHAMAGGDGAAKVQTEGLLFMRRMLDSDIVDIVAMTERLKTAKTTTESQLGIHAREVDDLGDDLKNWQADAQAAEQTAKKFEQRVAKLGTELSGLETAIVELGRELAGASALIAGEIDAAAPPPVRAVAEPAAAGERLP